MYNYGKDEMKMNTFFYDFDDVVENKKNTTKLERFTINGLFGKNDVTLYFDKEANIYIGENGLGKTTILNCIYYILCNDYERLIALPFNEIIIKFKGENEVLITKSDVSKFISKNGHRMRYRYREDEIVSFVESYLQNFGINDASF